MSNENEFEKIMKSTQIFHTSIPECAKIRHCKASKVIQLNVRLGVADFYSMQENIKKQADRDR